MRIVFSAQVEYVVEHVTQIEVEIDGSYAVCFPCLQLEPGWKLTAAEIGLIKAFALAGAADKLGVQRIQVGLCAACVDVGMEPVTNILERHGLTLGAA